MRNGLTLARTTLSPHLLAFLKKASYFLVYQTNQREMTLYGNDGGLNRPILSSEDVDLIDAERLAETLGLESSGRGRGEVVWGKRKAFFVLHYDDSPLARKIYDVLVDNKLPHAVRYDAEILALECDDERHEGNKLDEATLISVICAHTRAATT